MWVNTALESSNCEWWYMSGKCNFHVTVTVQFAVYFKSGDLSIHTEQSVEFWDVNKNPRLNATNMLQIFDGDRWDRQFKDKLKCGVQRQGDGKMNAKRRIAHSRSDRVHLGFAGKMVEWKLYEKLRSYAGKQKVRERDCERSNKMRGYGMKLRRLLLIQCLYAYVYTVLSISMVRNWNAGHTRLWKNLKVAKTRGSFLW